jgi:NitT/TauT family transport system substrate-binding protein
MRTARVLPLLFALAVAAPHAAAQEKITFAYLLDPVYEATLWPIRNGKVPGKVEIEARALAIPALLQATGAKTYDVIMTAVMGIPRARERGLDLKVMATGLRYHTHGDGADIWVKADSPIKSIDDLKGKTIGVYSLPSTGITLVRIALWKKWGVNVAYEGGDMKWVEVPAPQLPAALSAGNIDAATLIHSQAYAAAKSGAYRSLVRTAPAATEALGVRAVSAVHVGYAEKLAARPEAFKEFARMLKASIDYVHAHPDEVFKAAAAQTKVDADFFRTWFGTFSEIPMIVSDQDVTAMQRVWELAKELGLLKSHPKAADVVWEHALRR